MVVFSDALEAVKAGYKIAREGWNGKGMYLYLAESELPYPPLPDNKDWEAGSFPASKYIIMKTADRMTDTLKLRKLRFCHILL